MLLFIRGCWELVNDCEGFQSDKEIIIKVTKKELKDPSAKSFKVLG